MLRTLGTSSVLLNLSHVPCCGLEWLLCDGASGTLASTGLVCLNTSSNSTQSGPGHVVTLTRDTFQCGTSLCPCKQWQHASNPSLCLGLQNWTVGIDGVCRNESCPLGYRLYHTGSSLPCKFPPGCFEDDCNFLNLYETACHSKCG
jgi:hypothetical protein